MKPTVNINLGGYAFVIEEDAYKTMVSYLDSIRASLKDDADEVVSDIEVRIAEILNEKKTGENVISNSMVEEVVERIGKPDDIPSPDAPAPENRPADEKKRLYRDIDSRVFGGVCSGLGAWLGVDPVFLRIAFTVIALVGLLSHVEGLFLGAPVIYLVLWIAMPAARTVEQKCSMKGKPMKLDSFVSRASKGEFSKDIRDAASSPAVHKTARALMIVFGILLTAAGFGCLLSCIFIPKVPDIIFNLPSFGLFETDMPEAVVTRILFDRVFWWIVVAVVSVLGVCLLYGGLMLCFNFKSPSWKPGLVLLVIWVLSILSLASWVVKLLADMLPFLMS